MEKDIIIIGGGPGGYVAAIRAGQLGAKVTLIEARELGGTCLNRGCIPTKALYKNAEILHTLQKSNEFGIKIGSYEIDVEQVQERKQKVVDTLVGGIEQVIKSYDIEVISGYGSFKDNKTISVKLSDGSEREVTSDNIVIATGSKPFIPDLPGVSLEGVYTSDELLEFKEIPKRLSIIGGGVIGLEFANIFNAMGSEVTVFATKVLKHTDSDISKRITAFMKKQGIKIHTDTRAKGIHKSHSGLVVTGEGKKGEVQEEADIVLVSSGRKPLIEGLNLDGVGIEYDGKGIKVDKNFETNIKGIYAIGDVNGGVQLAHVASHQGISIVEKIMGLEPQGNHDVIPNCIFVSPEIAHVGVTEDEAKEMGIDYKSSKFMFGANGKALSMGEPDGFVKVLSNSKDNTIIGVHIMGPHAADLIHEGTLAISQKINIDAIKHTIHAHPTLSEAFLEAILGLNNEAIHMAKPRKR